MSVFVCDQLEADGSLLPVDRSTAVAPSIKRTWFLSLVTGLVGKVTRRDGSAIESTGPDEPVDAAVIAVVEIVLEVLDTDAETEPGVTAYTDRT